MANSTLHVPEDCLLVNLLIYIAIISYHILSFLLNTIKNNYQHSVLKFSTTIEELIKLVSDFIFDFKYNVIGTDLNMLPAFV